METEVQAAPRSDNFDLVAPPWHTLLVLGVVGILVVRGKLEADHVRAALNPNRVALYERTLLLEWLTLALVIFGVWLKGASVLTVLGDRWHSAREFVRDAGIGLLFLVATIVVTSAVGAHGDSANKSIQYLLPRGRLEMALWVALSMTAGICEEAIYRGYFQKQFTAFTKNVPSGIVLSAVCFGLSHSYQGAARASMIGVMGAMAGILAYWRRSVRPGMIAHIVQDVLGAFVRH
jgi:hypothetical protein